MLKCIGYILKSSKSSNIYYPIIKTKIKEWAELLSLLIMEINVMEYRKVSELYLMTIIKHDTK